MDKESARKNVLAKREALSEEEVISLSDKICCRVLALEEYKKARVIYAYIPFKNEVRIQKIIEDAWGSKKKVAVPRITDKEKMEFVFINSFDELECGYMGIMEPKKEFLKHPERIADEKEVFLLLPGLAFDKEGNRAGYGKGFYDRYIASHGRTKFFKAAACYSFQAFDHIEAEEHDIKADIVISDNF